MALIQVLPYVLLAFGTWLYVSRLQLSPEHSEQLAELLRWLPNRRTRSLESNPEVAPIEIIAVVVALSLGVLVLFRTHRSALRVAGHGDTGRHWMLILPSFSWIQIMSPALAAAAITLLGPRALPELAPLFDAKLVNASLLEYARAHQLAILFTAVPVVVILAVVGCKAVQFAAAEDLPFQTLFLGFFTLVILGALHGAAAVALSFGLVTLLGIANDALLATPLDPGLTLYLALQGTIHWMTMSVVCVMVLERAINRAADAAEAAA